MFLPEYFTKVIKDTMITLNLSMQKLHGHLVVAPLVVSELEMPKNFWWTITCCVYGHSLNLACSDSVKNSNLLKQALETTQEITKLIKFLHDIIVNKLRVKLILI